MPSADVKKPSLAVQVSKAVVWNTVFVPLRLAAEALATIVKLNFLTQAGYGLLALIGGANNGLGTVVDLGTTRALPKYIPEVSRLGGPRAVLRLLTAVFALQMAVLAVLTVGLTTLYREPYLAALRQRVLADPQLAPSDQASLIGLLSDFGWLVVGAIVALLFLGVCYDMLMAYLNSFFQQRAWNSIALTAGLLPQLLSVAAILLLPDVWDILGVLAASVLAPAIAVALAGWQVARLWLEQRRWSLAPDGSAFPPDAPWLPPGFLRYTGVSFLMTLTDFLASASFAIYLAGGVSDAAVLTAGAALARMALSYLYTPMVGVQVPLFTRVRQGEGGTLNGAYQSLVRLQLLLFVPGGVGLMLLAEPALVVVGPQYLAAATIVWALVPCLFLESLLTTAHNALIVYERLGIIIVSRLITLLVVAPLAWLLPPHFGLVGVALAFGLARVAAGLWVTANGMRCLGLRWPWRFTGRVLVASAVMGAVLVGMRSLLPPLPAVITLADRLREAIWLLGLVLAGAGTFLVVLRLLGGLEAQDRAQLAQVRLPLKRWWLRVL